MNFSFISHWEITPRVTQRAELSLQSKKNRSQKNSCGKKKEITLTMMELAKSYETEIVPAPNKGNLSCW